MRPNYYIHAANGQSSLVELCDRDGNVIAEIMPTGSTPHRQSVVDMLKLMVEKLNENEQDHFATRFRFHSLSTPCTPHT